MKTKVYNLIILDESGSMSPLKSATIAGCNETINTIKSAQKAHDNLDQYVSIFAFQSGSEVPSRYLVKNVPASAAEHIDAKMYEPWGATPLYDAIGTTVSELIHQTKHTDDVGSVTIITDGMENDSKLFNRHQIHRMIGELKEKGWNFNFIGANIDVEKVSASLNIDNSARFESDEDSVTDMFDKLSESNCGYMADLSFSEAAAPGSAERYERRKEASRKFFKK